VTALTLDPAWGGRARRAAGTVLVVGALYGALQLVWPTPVGVALKGMVLGSLTGLIAFGLALVYRSNRIVNFAQADLGVVPASLFVSLVNQWRWSYWAALPVALVTGPALGFAVERFVIRRFSTAPRLIVVVVTVGVAQILVALGLAIPFWMGSILPDTRIAPPFGWTLELPPVVFDANDLLAVTASVVAIVGLFGFLRYTNIGIAIRASAEDRDRASLLGINVGLTQNVAWVVAALLSAVAVTLRAGLVGVPLGSAFGPSILVRALAAAVLARMERFGTMFVAAGVLGVVETAILWNTGSSTLVDPVLFVIVLVGLLVQRRGRESRVEDQAASSWQDAADARPVPAALARLPEVRFVRWAGVAGVVALLVVLPSTMGAAKVNLAAAVAIYAMIAVSLVLLTGWSGEISLGHMAFVAVGAAATSIVNVHRGWDLSISLLLSGLVGAVASVVIGLPALRIRGLFLAMATLAFAVTTSSYLLDRDRFEVLPDNIVEQVERLPLFGRFDIGDETTFYYVCLVVLGLMLLSVRGLQRSRIARVLVAARENGRTAQAFGVDIGRAKLTAFALSGFYASLAGGLLAYHQRALGEQIFAPAESIRVLTMVVVGGLGSVPGALLGAVFLKSTEWFNTVVPEQFRTVFTFAGSGIGLLGVLMFLPGGLGGGLLRWRDAYLRRVARRRGLAIRALTHDPTEPAGPTTTDRAVRRRDAVAAWRPPPSRAPRHVRRFLRRAAPELDYFSFPELALGGRQPNLLSLRSVDVAYGQVQVLFGVNLEVAEGETIALLGTNGAGKSTVLRALSGLVSPTRGSISWEGTDIAGYPPHRVAALGLAHVPGGRGIFPTLTVSEHLRLAGWLDRHDRAGVGERRAEVLGLFPGLAQRLDDQAAALSGGQQQMLALAMAFMARPRVLVIDELSLGLAPVVVAELLDVVRDLQRRGTTILLVEQSVNLALTVAHTAYFMEKGEVRFRGPTHELLERPDILRSVFLEGAVAPVPGASSRAERRRPATTGVAPLEVRHLVKRFDGLRAIDDVSLQVGEGEILGIVGPNGAGKTTLFDLVSGFLAPDEGAIVLDGRDVTTLRADRRARLGLARSFQDARLFGALTVRQVVTTALDGHRGTRGAVAAALDWPGLRAADRRAAARVDELLELMGLAGYADSLIGELSTGTRRVVDLACQAGLAPKVLLLDEPSSGIAQREAEALGPVLLRIRELTGASILLIEHDMPLVSGVADRLLALDLGRVVVDGDADVVLNDEQVVASYLGSTRAVVARSGRAAGAIGEVVGQ